MSPCAPGYAYVYHFTNQSTTQSRLKKVLIVFFPIILGEVNVVRLLFGVKLTDRFVFGSHVTQSMKFLPKISQAIVG